MRPKKLPTEFGINMYLDKQLVLQQEDLGRVSGMNYFNEDSQCHIYFICRRPRISILKESFKATDSSIELVFRVQREDKYEEIPLVLPHYYGSSELAIESQYPYNTFKIFCKGEEVSRIKAALFLQSNIRALENPSYLDFEVLYVGQSYGVEGARTAPERLANHSTLQGIYAEAMQKNPDYEIWLLLASFKQLNLTVMSPESHFEKEDWEKDDERFTAVNKKLNYDGISEQQKINFTEAALIKYFQPPYNKTYKDSFPNPAHSTYSECYDLDINSVAIELDTHSAIGVSLFSQTVKPIFPAHMHDFLLHSAEERRSMFDVLGMLTK
ncbi:MAG TPA: hypothetical protein VL093_04395 [Flavipsychrobacter sp.]|nr:hypothetical protein [Flavipsychrobacter sp.]